MGRDHHTASSYTAITRVIGYGAAYTPHQATCRKETNQSIVTVSASKQTYHINSLQVWKACVQEPNQFQMSETKCCRNKKNNVYVFLCALQHPSAHLTSSSPPHFPNSRISCPLANSPHFSTIFIKSPTLCELYKCNQVHYISVCSCSFMCHHYVVLLQFWSNVSQNTITSRSSEMQWSWEVCKTAIKYL